MATIKFMSQMDSTQVKDRIRKVGGSYKYKNQLTGDEITADDVLTKQELLAMRKDDPAQTFELRAKGNWEYDHLVVEFNNPETAELIAETILHELSHPNFSYDKDYREVTVQGEKTTYYDLHKKPDGTVHLHIVLNNWTVSGDNVYASTTMDRNSVREAVQMQINNAIVDKLGEKAEQVFITSGKTNQLSNSRRVSQDTKEQVQKLLTGDLTTDEMVNKEPSYVNPDIISILAKSEQDKINSIAQELETRKQALAKLLEFQTVSNENVVLHEQNRRLLDQNKALSTENEKVVELVEQNQLLETSNSEYIEQLSNANNRLISLQEQIEEKEKELAEVNELQAVQEDELAQKQILLDQIGEDLDSLRKTVTVLESDKASLENKVSSQTSTIDNLQIALDARNSQLELEKSFRENLEKQQAETDRRLQEAVKQSQALAEQNRAMQARIEEDKRLFETRLQEQQAQIEELKKDNAHKTKENSILKEIVQVCEEKLEQASMLINTLSAKLRNVATKNIVTQFVSDVKALKDVNEQIKARDVHTEKVTADIAEIRERFKINRDNIVKAASESGKKPSDKPEDDTGGTTTPKKK